jgi:general secretion pathway protein H
VADSVVAGFSLIEILVVVVILGVLALAVTLGSATAGGERRLAQEAERMQALVRHACNQAELSGREIGLRVGASGYSFSMLGFDGWTRSERTDELRPRAWAPGMRVELLRDGSATRLIESDDGQPQVVCFSSGELSPFLLRMQLGDVASRYELRGEVDGDVVLDRVAALP